MNFERILVAAALATGIGALLLSDPTGANATRQGDGALAQEPMHLGATVSPNFIMAIDDSGSMTFQTMLPGQDGAACWSDKSKSFFNGTTLLTSGDTCRYHYVMMSLATAGDPYNGIPPFDQFGFARSPDFNPSYFDPFQTYEPWVDEHLATYAPADVNSTRIDPRNSATVNTVNLFAPQRLTEDRNSFEMRNGMWMPKGVKYYSCDGRGCSWVESKGVSWNSGTQDVAIEYVPAVVFLKAKVALTGYTAASEVKDACGTGCSLYKYQPTSAAAKQNFANWFSFYGNRNRAMIAGMTRALVDISTMRVGYFTINKRQTVTMRDMDLASDKTALIKDVIGLPASGGTPNRLAVEHMAKQFNTNADVIKHACQKNAGMLFTDGYSNQGGPEYGNVDQAMGVPFSDAHSNTLADIAAYHYNNTLRAGSFATGKVPLSNPQLCENGTTQQKKGLDCNANLHMNFYGVTLGAKGKLFGVSYGVTPDGGSNGQLATDQALASATSPAWAARADDDPSTVDEIWHATMNARGRYINAKTPIDITNAMRDVLASVGVGGGASGSLAITGSRVGDGSLSVEPKFDRNGTDWYSDIIAGKPVRATGGALTYAEAWKAASKFPASRNILYGTTSGGVKPAVKDFRSNGPAELSTLCANYPSGACGPMSGTQIASLGVTISQAIAYLAGEDSLEGGALRARTTVLGDIINSTPVVSAPTDDYGYALLRKADGSFEYDPYKYNKYLDDKKTQKRMVYVGANDGMLHGFHGDTGVERFAYIPAVTVGYMGNLLFPKSPDFQHRYYVDGPVTVSDALIRSAWSTVLVGTTGAGGRSVFGLDVGNAAATDFTNNKVLWEINDKVSGDMGNRIGYVLGKPVIVPVRQTDGKPKWKAIFGAGNGNRLNDAAATKGTATLMIVDIETGQADYIDAKESNNSNPNGLGNVVAVDLYEYRTGTGYVRGSDGMVDTVYGGDQQGNLWKFDLTKSGTDRVTNGKPLFTAKDGTTASSKRQPIMGGLEATIGPRNGVLILFGTGSFSFDGDKQNRDTQSVYGVLDILGEPGASWPLGRGNLQGQSVNKLETGAAGNTISSTQVNYFTQRGWYLDLKVTGATTASGERMVGYPRLEGERLYFPTYAPEEGDACSGGGVNYLYGLAALTGSGGMGGARQGNPITGTELAEGVGRKQLTSDGSAPIKDVNVYTTGKQAALTGTPTDADLDAYNALSPEYCLAVVSVAGADPLYRVRPCGRQSWRQIR